ncbi:MULTISPECIES: DUF2203 domain-containing protein [Candidatus Nitrosocaldus]|jgi:hypothetical protein|uniref:DUF2203 domain-containing protein n=1 Tax=Candidatus Nitrosocaldus cavascurensis TaxID=2058097 RepID=A0A2K5ARV8_9ARCH|nr:MULTISPECIES: DUF2203 domain-containing protein [Candidatus Nitrosocaldus]SPC34381.1 conserved protein of unknown function [Candidatus Nitrosocaldus cavascurensis]
MMLDWIDGGVSMFQYFTPQQANRILGEVRRRFNNIVAIRDEVLELQEELQSIVDHDASLQVYIEKKQELNSALTRLYAAIEELEAMGVVLKSIDEGLIDFPAKRFGEDVWLCWKSGEDEVKFWHGKDEGFMGRKPLPVSDESLV